MVGAVRLRRAFFVSRHDTRCGVVFPLSHDLSQVHGKGDLGDEDDGKKGDTIMLLDGDDDGRPSEERQKSRAEEFRSRSLLKRSSPLSMRRFLWPSDSSDGCAQRRGCGWLAKAQATARVDLPTAPFSFAVRTKESTTCTQVLCECLAMCLSGNRP